MQLKAMLLAFFILHSMYNISPIAQTYWLSQQKIEIIKTPVFSIYTLQFFKSQLIFKLYSFCKSMISPLPYSFKPIHSWLIAVCPILYIWVHVGVQLCFWLHMPVLLARSLNNTSCFPRMVSLKYKHNNCQIKMSCSRNNLLFR